MNQCLLLLVSWTGIAPDAPIALPVVEIALSHTGVAESKCEYKFERGHERVAVSVSWPKSSSDRVRASLVLSRHAPGVENPVQQKDLPWVYEVDGSTVIASVELQDVKDGEKAIVAYQFLPPTNWPNLALQESSQSTVTVKGGAGELKNSSTVAWGPMELNVFGKQFPVSASTPASGTVMFPPIDATGEAKRWYTFTYGVDEKHPHFYLLVDTLKLADGQTTPNDFDLRSLWLPVGRKVKVQLKDGPTLVGEVVEIELEKKKLLAVDFGIEKSIVVKPAVKEEAELHSYRDYYLRWRQNRILTFDSSDVCITYAAPKEWIKRTEGGFVSFGEWVDVDLRRISVEKLNWMLRNPSDLSEAKVACLVSWLQEQRQEIERLARNPTTYSTTNAYKVRSIREAIAARLQGESD